MRIFLIGYMGSGKSTVGRGLAKLLKMNFIDLDTYIESRNFKTIPEIFAQEGEGAFRKAEQKALHEVSGFENVIVATGGGAPCFFDNMEVIKKAGKSLYLNGSPRLLAERLLHSKTERPLIKGKSEAELIAFIDETLNKRSQWYKQADVVLDFDHDLTIEEVKSALGI
jgi:shikimate kinase